MNGFVSPLRYQRERSQHKAFSLLEVAFALVIFVIGAIALLRIFPGGLDVLENSGNRRVASQMSQNVLTSYNSGVLTSTVPDSVYHTDDTTGLWDDYPYSAFGLRRQKGTIPTGVDDFNNAKEELNRIEGEKQGISNGVVYTNYVARNQVELVRSGAIKNVAIGADGKIDFRNAIYSDSKRNDKPNLPFREPILNILSIVDSTNAAATVPLAGDTAVIRRDPTASKTYNITFSIDPASIAFDMDSTVDLSSATAPTFNANGTDCSSAAGPNTASTIVVQLTVPAVATTPQANQVVIFTFPTPPAKVSVSRASYSILIASDNTGVPTPVSGALLPVRAPYDLRQPNDVQFYVSYNWTDTNATPTRPYQGVVAQPMHLPAYDATDAFVTFTEGATETIVANPNATITFNQPLTTVAVQADRVKLNLSALTTTFADSDSAAIPLSQLHQLSLNYNVRSWDYISEEVSQFGTPFSDQTTTNYVNSNTPTGLAQLAFMSTAGYAGNQVPVSDVREIRTRVGNLRGTVQVKGFYDQSSQTLDIDPFNINAAAFPAGVTTTVTPQEFVRQKKALAKQGRLYIPAKYGAQTLSRARIYYRSQDAWAQQIGVSAPHYVPFDLMPQTAPPRAERWREYYYGNDGYLYFHASEAGKMVEYVYKNLLGSFSAATMEIKPEVLFVDTLPGGVPATFAKRFPTITGDARSNKYYLARSRDTVGVPIFDVRRPEGTSGVSVRTLWVNDDRYAQEVAQ